MCGFGAVLNLLGPIPLHLRAAHLGIQRNVPKRTPETARIAAFAAMRLRFWHVNCRFWHVNCFGAEANKEVRVMSPTMILSNEHRVIEQVLNCLEVMADRAER